jgi:hypothetical protein
MSQCTVPFTLACPICHAADTLLEMVFSGQKIIVFAGYCPTCHSMWHSVYQRKTGDITHYPVTFYVWSRTMMIKALKTSLKRIRHARWRHHHPPAIPLLEPAL